MSPPSIAAAFVAGFVSFISPCVLPLLPAYLSFLSGLTVQELSAQKKRTRLLGISLMFTSGFTLVFTLMGIVFAGGMSFVGRNESKIFNVAAGFVIIFLGLNVLFDFIRVLGSDSRLIQRYAGKGRGQVNAFLMGLAFAAGWSPCIGPILASILMMAARNANIAYAALLLIAYSLGFGIPFIASALFFEKLSPLLRFFKNHGNSVRIISGILLIGFGVAMSLSSVSRISAVAAQLGSTLLNFTTSSPGLSKIIGAGIWSLLALLPIRTLLRTQKTTRDQAHLKDDEPGMLRSSIIIASLFLGVFVVLAFLELRGKIKVLEIISHWLTFSGI